MKTTIFWVVSPTTEFVHKLCTNDCKTAILTFRTLQKMNDVPSDLTLCTNECATTFLNGMVFSNGELFKRA